MEFMRKAKGSISIFLCLVLLPMVTYSTMIIDASRMQVARTNVASAGDLAMNAALSEYEKVLQDMYGLFAMAQSEGDFSNQLEAYFTETVEGKFTPFAAGDGKTIENLINSLLNTTFTPDPADKINGLNNLLLMETENFNYHMMPGSTLANQAVMKRQIIEYMKYKGPISLATTFIPKIEFLKDSDKQTEAVKKKVTYTKKLDALKDPCMEAWVAIEGAYDESGTCIQDGYKQLREQFINLEFTDYYITDNPSVYTNKTGGFAESLWVRSTDYYYKMAEAILLHKNSKVTYADKLEWDDSIDDSYHIDYFSSPHPMDSDQYLSELESYLLNTYAAFVAEVNNIEGALGDKLFVDLNSDFEDFKKGNLDVQIKNECFKNISDINTKFDEYSHKLTPYYLNAENKPIKADKYMDDLEEYFQYQNEQRLIVEKQIQNGNFKKFLIAKHRGEDISDSYNNALSILNTIVENAWQDFDNYVKDNSEEPPEDFETKKDELYKKYSDLFDMHVDYAMENDIMKIALESSFWDNYKTAVEALFNNVSCRNETDRNDSYFMEYANFYSKEAIVGWSMYLEALEKLKNNCTEINTALDAVISAITEANTAKGDWDSSIEKLSAGTTKTSMKNDLESTTDGLKLEDVQALKGCVDEIITALENRIEVIHKVKIFGISLDCSEPITPELVSNILDNDSESLFRAYYDHNTEIGTEEISELYNEGLTIITNKFVGLSSIGSFTVEAIDGTPEAKEKFYLTLKSICESKKPGVTTEEATQLDNINDYSVGDEEGSADAPVEASEPTEPDPDESKDNGASGINIGEIYNEIADIALQTPMLDQETPDPADPDVDATTSVNGMTIDPDDDDYSDQAGDAESSLDGASGILSLLTDLATTVTNHAYLEEYFTEMFTCRTTSEKDILLNGYTIPAPGTDAVNLAKTVNRNTPWFGKEVEYLIWGDPDMKDNWVKTDALIYTIRFALNAIYAFTSADIQMFATKIATAIAGWTVIGVPIIAACVTVALALAETAYDLVLLHQGEDVAIYKSKSTFVCAPGGFLKNVTETLVKSAADAAITAINKQIDNALAAAGDDVDKMVECATDFVDKQVDEQMNHINATVTDLYINPLYNKLMIYATEIDSKVESAVEVGKGELEEGIRKTVEDAFIIIKSTIDDSQESDSKVMQVARLAFDKIDQQAVADKIVAAVNAKIGDNRYLNFKLTEELENVKGQLVVDTIGDSCPDAIISAAIFKALNPVRDEFEEQSLNVANRLKEAGEKGAKNLKQAINEEITGISDSISGTVGERIDEATKGLNVDNKKDPAESKGFTLNYKEYCKIFVFIKLAAGQEGKMLNRAAALMEANVKTANGSRNDTFKIVNAYTLIGVESKVKMGTIFPWGVAVQDSSGATGNVGMKLDLDNLGENFVTINYQAVNGY